MTKMDAQLQTILAMQYTHYFLKIRAKVNRLQNIGIQLCHKFVKKESFYTLFRKYFVLIEKYFTNFENGKILLLG